MVKPLMHSDSGFFRVRLNSQTFRVFPSQKIYRERERRRLMVTIPKTHDPQPFKLDLELFPASRIPGKAIP